MFTQDNTLTFEMLNALLKHVPDESEAVNLTVALDDGYATEQYPKIAKTVLLQGKIVLALRIRCADCEHTTGDYYIARDDDGLDGWHKVIDSNGEQMADTRESDYYCEEHSGGGIEVRMYTLEIGEDGEVSKRTDVSDHPVVREAIEHLIGDQS